MSPPRVLCVDDEDRILKVLAEQLSGGFEVETTPSPEAALGLLGDRRHAVLVCDYLMPSLNGIDLMELARKASPDTVRILLTGHGSEEIAAEAVERGLLYRYIVKPWREDGLRQAVRQAAERHAAERQVRSLRAQIARKALDLKQANEGLERRVAERTAEAERLHREIQGSLLAVVEVLSGLAETRSTVMGSHARRVAALAKGMGGAAGIEGRELVELEVAGLLHDIGKTGFPDALLEREERQFTAKERETWRTHPERGEAILRKVPGLLHAPLWVRHHHERFGGGGIPDGLKGEEIPLGARLLAAADAYDKALNGRHTFRTITSDGALASLRERSPSELDPAALKALEAAIRKGVEVGGAAEIEIRIRDLRPGMVLSRDLKGGSGALLMAKESAITEENIERVLGNVTRDPTIDSVFIRR